MKGYVPGVVLLLGLGTLAQAVIDYHQDTPRNNRHGAGADDAGLLQQVMGVLEAEGLNKKIHHGNLIEELKAALHGHKHKGCGAPHPSTMTMPAAAQAAAKTPGPTTSHPAAPAAEAPPLPAKKEKTTMPAKATPGPAPPGAKKNTTMAASPQTPAAAAAGPENKTTTVTKTSTVYTSGSGAGKGAAQAVAPCAQMSTTPGPSTVTHLRCPTPAPQAPAADKVPLPRMTSSANLSSSTGADALGAALPTTRPRGKLADAPQTSSADPTTPTAPAAAPTTTPTTTPRTTTAMPKAIDDAKTTTSMETMLELGALLPATTKGPADVAAAPETTPHAKLDDAQSPTTSMQGIGLASELNLGTLGRRTAFPAP